MSKKRPRGRPPEGRDRCVPTNMSLAPKLREDARKRAKEEGVSLSLWTERLMQRGLSGLTTGTVLLDTCAIQTIPRRTLEKGRRFLDLAFSPVSLYELASHLSEGDERSFKRVRGNVLKCEIPRLLQDPFADHAVRAGVHGLVHPTRFDDVDVLPQILRALRAVQSREEFSRSTVTFPNGDVGVVGELGDKIEDQLSRMEDRFLEIYEIAIPELRELGGEVSDEVLVRGAMSMCKHLADDYSSDLGLRPRDLYVSVTRSAMLNRGYTIARAAAALEQEAKGGLPKPDRNDAEDAAILYHLDLIDDNILVTGDGGLRDATNRFLRAYNERYENQEILQSRCRCMAIEEFVEKVDAH